MPLPVRSGNPGLNDKTFSGLPRPMAAGDRKTLQGAINKSFLLLVVLLAAAFYPWSQFAATGDASVVWPTTLIGLIGGLITALVISFKPTTATYLAIPYAALEGLVLGGISAVLERKYPGIAIQAVGLTFAVLAVMLVAYSTRLIQATQRFRVPRDVVHHDEALHPAALADQLAATFHERAKTHDLDGTFPQENYAGLHEQGFLRLVIPKEYGGDGAPLYDLVMAMDHLSRGDGGTGLAQRLCQ